MKQKSFILLVLIMAMALPGIIVVQIIWINNAVKIQKQEHRSKVIQALTNSSEKIESVSYVKYFTRNKMVVPPPPPPPPGERVEIVVPQNVRLPELDSIFSKRIKIEINSDNKDTESVIVDGKKIDISSYSSELNKNSNNVDITITNTDTIISYEPSEYKRDIFIKRFNEKTRKINWVADKLVSEVLIHEKFNVVDFKKVTEIVDEELKRKDIELPYSLVLVDSGKIIESSTPISDTIDFEINSYKASLFPNDILKQEKFVAIRFMGENRYFMKSINWLLFSSLLFTLLIVTAFVLSIYFILNQKKISQVKSDFINNMTHEFKTPIATISVAVDTLMNSMVRDKPNAVKEYALLIKQENRRMNGHVENILRAARLERNETEFVYKSYDIHIIIEEVCEIFKLKMEQNKGNIIIDFKAQNSILLIDKVHIYNCLTNIVDNAIKYSPEAARIKISTQSKSNGVLISVQDNGIGMSKQEQSKIFDTFYRVSTGNLHNTKGFGLGLSYVKSVIDAHKGTINVESELGNGSTFTLFLNYTL